MILDIVIPFYNPSKGWEKKFADKYTKLVDTCLRDIKDDINLIIVNDGSTRNFTEAESSYLQTHLPHVQIVTYQQNMGKGYALRKGVEQATTDYCIYTDYDFPFGLQIVRDIFDELKTGTDIVTGCRRKGNYFNSLPFKRRMVSKGLIIFNRQFLRLPVYDTQAGIKGFNKYGRVMFLKTTINRFLFDMEFILISSKINGVVIKSLPVNITHETKLSDFGMKVMRQEFKNLLSIVFRKKMEQQAKKILFSVDLEEFDIPEEYGHAVPLEQKLQVSMQGMQKLQDLMSKHKVAATIFTTAYWATQFPDYIKEIAQQHEIASHTFYHNSFKIEDLATSRKTLTEISGQEVVGLRMPRMQDISRKDVREAGYVYDSSLHPTWLPGRYNNLNKPRTLFQNEGVWELPASVTPVLRIPIFWLAFKNFPIGFYKALCKRILNHDGYMVFYVHPWEFTNLSAYPLPGMVRRVDNDVLLNRLNELFTYLGKHGEFATHKSLVYQQ